MTPLLEESNSDTISCVAEKIFPLKTSHFTQITWAVVLHLLNLNYINSDFSFTWQAVLTLFSFGDDGELNTIQKLQIAFQSQNKYCT